MEIIVLVLVVINAYLFYRLRKLEKRAITGVKTKNDVVTLSLDKQPFNELKIKN